MNFVKQDILYLEEDSCSLRRQRISKTAGFTLIELLASILIIGLLSALALPSFLNQAAKARGSEAKSSLGSINRAQQAYRYQNGKFAPTLNELRSSGLSLDERYYTFMMVGSSNTVITDAIPSNLDMKVYAAGAVIGSNDRLEQVVCESINTKGESTNNNAVAALITGSNPSASCSIGREVK